MDLNLKQGTPNWHKARASHLGATDSCAVMNGIHFNKDVKQLYNEKIKAMDAIANNTYEPPIDSPNAAMKRGKELEAFALSRFELETGYLMSQKTWEHDSIKFLLASFDGIELDGKAVVEIKCPGLKDHGIALDGEVPEKYMPQLQHQMEVAGLDKIYYMSYANDNDYKILEVYKDEEYTKNMLQKEAEFWKCVIERTPPESTKPDINEIKSEEFRLAVERHKELLAHSLRFEKDLEESKKKLLEMANFCPAQGFGLQITKVITKGRLDYSNIPELKGVDLEKHRKPSIESWRINLEK